MFTFFSENKNIFYLIILAITLPILVISYGYIRNMPRNRDEDYQSNNHEENLVDIEEIAKSLDTKDQILTSSDTLVYKKYTYSLCNHTNREEESIKYNDIGLSRAEFLSRYPDWDIKYFNDERIIMEKVSNGYCPKHYVLQELDGFIAICQPDIDSSLDIIKHTDIPIELLSKELQTQVQNGLAVESLEDVENMMEDIAS